MFLKRLHRVILGEKASPEKGSLSRTALNDRIYSEFISRQKRVSTSDGLLFPTNFVIYLSQNDYEVWNETFPYTVKEVVDRFNVAIRQMTRKKYKNYVPHSQFWQFQFSAFPEGGLVLRDGEPETGLEDGDVLIVSKLHPDRELNEVNSIFEGPERVVTTLHRNNSRQTNLLAINPEALKHVDIRSKDKFRVPFAPWEKKKEVPRNEEERVNASRTVSARLVVLDGPGFLTGSGVSSSFLMNSRIVYIAGKNAGDTYGGYPVARLDTDSVGVPHLQLRHIKDNEFQVAAWGDTMVAEHSVEADGKHWQVAHYGDQILIDGEIAIEIKKPLV